MSNNWKKYIVAISVLVMAFGVGHAYAESEGWKEIANNIDSDQTKSLEDTAALEKYIKMDKASLEKEVANLKAQDKKEGDNLTALENQYQALRKEEDQHKKDLENEKDEIQAIEDTVRATCKDAISVSRDNPITAEYPDRKEVLDKIANSKRFPGMNWIKALVEFYFSEMEESGRIVRRNGNFIGPDGRETSGEILRIGRFTTYYRLPNGDVGFLKPEADGTRLDAVQGEAPSRYLRQISDYFDKKSDILPIDLSSGNEFLQWTKSQTFGDWLATGGPIMYVILVVGIIAVLIGLERIFVLSTKSKASEQFMAQLKELANQGNWKEAKALCSSKSRVPTCQMLDAALEHVGYSQDVMENALQESILRQVPKLERFLPTLALLAVIAPLLGLLGTVQGMIQTFKIITEVGTGNPTLLASGISVALYTTYFGLMIAVPIMVVHHIFKSRVEKIVVDMEEKGTAFIITLIKNQGTK